MVGEMERIYLTVLFALMHTAVVAEQSKGAKAPDKKPLSVDGGTRDIRRSPFLSPQPVLKARAERMAEDSE